MYYHLTSWDNLQLAYSKASKGKRGHANVATFEHRLEDNLLELQAELRTQTYHPGPYTSFYVHEPKRRLISAAPFRDRVVHHALCNLIEPRFERSFTADSYANRLDKGTHRALHRCQYFARRYRYALQCDIQQFFPAIDHAVLRAILARKIDDDQVLWLVDQILSSGEGLLSEQYDSVYFPGDDLFAINRPRGLPIGNLTSQFWANCYLNPFDHFVKRELRCPAYVRFVDDFICFGDDKRMLWDWHRAIIERCARLRLTIHPRVHPRPVTEGIPFLGFIVYPNHRRLKRRKGVYFGRKLRRQVDACARGQISFEAMDASVQGWINHVRYGNTIGLRKAMFHSIPLIRSASCERRTG
ncbi:MAG: RNA-dependent DNA polymerase [Halieaceae bacterium]|nr:RNA-dependent DNA polymerase [Halieaceae bacterium]